MDFLQASIDAALKSQDGGSSPLHNPDFQQSNGDFGEDEGTENVMDGLNFDEDAFNSFADEFVFPSGSGEEEVSLDAEADDDQPPILEESTVGGNDDGTLSVLNQMMTEAKEGVNQPQMVSRGYQEEVIPLDNCNFTGNRLTITGCKYEFVRLNVRANIYFRCVLCYGIYQRRRAHASRTKLPIEVPSVGSLKLIAATGEIRGNPDRPSGIGHCCEIDKYKEDLNTPTRNKNAQMDRKMQAALPEAIKLLTASFNNNTHESEETVPLEKCKFNDKRLEIEGCKYIFSRTQSGPRDYYRCTGCIALYHKRHFRKLPTPKIGSLSLLRDSGILTGNPMRPRGLPHICDDPELVCPPLRNDNRSRPRMSSAVPPALASIFDASKNRFNAPMQQFFNRPNMSVSMNNLFNGARPPMPNFGQRMLERDQEVKINNIFKRELSNINQKAHEFSPPSNKYRRLIEEAMGPAIPSNNKIVYTPSNHFQNGNGNNYSNVSSPRSMKQSSTNGSVKDDEDGEAAFPHTNDLQPIPRRSLPDFDLSFEKRRQYIEQCFNHFPKFPNQGKVVIFADTLLREFQSKSLNPSTALVRAEFPILPTHVMNLCVRARLTTDCFAKTRHVFFSLGYDIMRCIDVEEVPRKVNSIQNEFLAMRHFLDEEKDVNGILTFVTIPEIGMLTDDLKHLNSAMRQLIQSSGRPDIQVCDWAAEYATNSLAMSNLDDRMKVLISLMSSMCGVEIMDED